MQKNFLRHVMEVPKSTPTSGLFLEMGILPVQFVIEVRQIMFLKKIIARDPSDPVKKVNLEMLKYLGENNWANNVLDLRCKYNLPQKDENVNNLTWPDWKIMVKYQLKRSAFLTFFEKCLTNKKTKHLWYSKLGIQPYITSLDPATARSVFKARLNMYEIKANFKKICDSDISCPFCKIEDETFEHIFLCSSGVLCKNSLKENNLLKLYHFSCLKYLKDTGEFLLRYKKYREIML